MQFAYAHEIKLRFEAIGNVQPINKHLIKLTTGSAFQWERRSHNLSFETLFISVFYMAFTWICNKNVIMRYRTSKVFLNLFS